MASALLAPQLPLPTASAKLLECPEPLVSSIPDMRSAEAPLDVKCLASEIEQSAAAALLGLCSSASLSTVGSRGSSPTSPRREDSEPTQLLPTPGLITASWESASPINTGSPRPRNGKDGTFSTPLPSTPMTPLRLAVHCALACAAIACVLLATSLAQPSSLLAHTAFALPTQERHPQEAAASSAAIRAAASSMRRPTRCAPLPSLHAQLL